MHWSGILRISGVSLETCSVRCVAELKGTREGSAALTAGRADSAPATQAAATLSGTTTSPGG